MKTKYLRGIAVFFLSLFFCAPTGAHDDLDSHAVFKGIGDGYRALMSKTGYGESFFTLYVYLDVVITNETGTKAKQNVVQKLGTTFIPDCNGCGGNFLLTNNHVADVNEFKKETIKEIHDQYEALNPPQKVNLHFSKTYRAVDSSGVTFLVSLVKKSDSIDAALFRFEKEPNPPRKSFILQDEHEVSFSPVGVIGSPLKRSNMLVPGNIARAGLSRCSGDKKQEYLLFMSSINPGNSGGPLYNFETDKVNGMVTAFLTSGENGERNSMISCAVPASALIRFLKENVPPKK
jgi:S1-C subfamily serine protease